MNNSKKTSFVVFLTFLITSAMYLIVFTFVPALSSLPRSIAGLISGKNNRNLSQRINEIDSYLEGTYINKYDREQLDDMAVRGYVAGLGDKYSMYYTKQEFDELNAEMKGNYKGIGIEVAVDDEGYIQVLKAYKNAPASEAGMQAEDRIVKVDKTEVNGDNFDLAIDMIKGVGKYGKNDTMTITVRRGEKLLDLKVTRREVVAQSVETKMLSGNIGYIALSSFMEESDEDFIKETNSLISKGAKSLIIDLRNNGGGMLDTVVNISDFLLPEGKILTIKGKESEPVVFSSEESCIDIPICVLINGNSASASEVLAGALKDHSKATIVGETSYGKGVVQTLYPLSDGSGIKLTTAKYYTPSGECIDQKGIKPDKTVEMELTKALDLYSLDEDVQLKEAMKQVKKLKK